VALFTYAIRKATRHMDEISPHRTPPGSLGSAGGGGIGWGGWGAAGCWGGRYALSFGRAGSQTKKRLPSGAHFSQPGQILCRFTRGAHAMGVSKEEAQQGARRGEMEAAPGIGRERNGRKPSKEGRRDLLGQGATWQGAVVGGKRRRGRSTRREVAVVSRRRVQRRGVELTKGIQIGTASYELKGMHACAPTPPTPTTTGRQ
jgi:hypothetical protein